ncbi:MAG: CAP domain-containing protein [Paracoccus denitrificans]|uniref:CAP domain-containing protein n=1 Tax=Paracoccus denitrificans TaxID=266 RepID=A0A533ICJ6_PARDE|nr:MAG: CAP domain-containing protein [Paracoccus denitrificans]
MWQFAIGRVQAAAVLLIVALGFAQPVFAELSSRPSTSSPRLPSGVVRIEGKGNNTIVSSGGSASCRHVTAAEAAAALSMTNSIRAQRHLSPLSTNSKLQQAAAEHACEMASRGVMSHRGASGSGPAGRVKRIGYRPRLTAENIAAGRFDLNRVQQEWAQSPGHLSNILQKRARHFGIGYAVAADGKTIFWTAVYANGR